MGIGGVPSSNVTNLRDTLSGFKHYFTKKKTFCKPLKIKHLEGNIVVFHLAEGGCATNGRAL